MFCTNCEHEIVLRVLQIKKQTISHSQFIKKSGKSTWNGSSNFGLIEATMDLSKAELLQLKPHSFPTFLVIKFLMQING